LGDFGVFSRLVYLLYKADVHELQVSKETQQTTTQHFSVVCLCVELCCCVGLHREENQGLTMVSSSTTWRLSLSRLKKYEKA